jgi:hypothetical protein
LERLAFSGRSAAGTEPELGQALRVITLSAWLDGEQNVEMAVNEEDGSRQWVFDQVFFRLHYGLLSDEAGYVFEEDTFFPPVEFLVGKVIVWENQEVEEGEAILLDLAISLPEVAEGSGFVSGVEVPRTELEFFGRAEEAQPLHEKRNSLGPCREPANLPCVDTDHEARRRYVPLQFVNLTRTFGEDDAVLEDICQNQIDAACIVWGQQGALDIEVEPKIVEGLDDQKDKFKVCDEVEAGELSGLSTHSHIQVFIVDTLAISSNGGACGDAGVGAAYIILEGGMLQGNDFLLAHELGHALGLGHPGTGPTNVSIPGDFGSIAQASTPNSSKNTLNNCQVFTSPAVNPLARDRKDSSRGWIADCFRPG